MVYYTPPSPPPLSSQSHFHQPSASALFPPRLPYTTVPAASKALDPSASVFVPRTASFYAPPPYMLEPTTAPFVPAHSPLLRLYDSSFEPSESFPTSSSHIAAPDQSYPGEEAFSCTPRLSSPQHAVLGLHSGERYVMPPASASSPSFAFRCPLPGQVDGRVITFTTAAGVTRLAVPMGTPGGHPATTWPAGPTDVSSWAMQPAPTSTPSLGYARPLSGFTKEAVAAAGYGLGWGGPPAGGPTGAFAMHLPQALNEFTRDSVTAAGYDIRLGAWPAGGQIGAFGSQVPQAHTGFTKDAVAANDVGLGTSPAGVQTWRLEAGSPWMSQAISAPVRAARTPLASIGNTLGTTSNKVNDSASSGSASAFIPPIRPPHAALLGPRSCAPATASTLSADKAVSIVAPNAQASGPHIVPKSGPATQRVVASPDPAQSNTSTAAPPWKAPKNKGLRQQATVSSAPAASHGLKGGKGRKRAYLSSGPAQALLGVHGAASPQPTQPTPAVGLSVLPPKGASPSYAPLLTQCAYVALSQSWSIPQAPAPPSIRMPPDLHYAPYPTSPSTSAPLPSNPTAFRPIAPLPSKQSTGGKKSIGAAGKSGASQPRRAVLLDTVHWAPVQTNYCQLFDFSKASHKIDISMLSTERMNLLKTGPAAGVTLSDKYAKIGDTLLGVLIYNIMAKNRGDVSEEFIVESAKDIAQNVTFSQILKFSNLWGSEFPWIHDLPPYANKILIHSMGNPIEKVAGMKAEVDWAAAEKDLENIFEPLVKEHEDIVDQEVIQMGFPDPRQDPSILKRVQTKMFWKEGVEGGDRWGAKIEVRVRDGDRDHVAEVVCAQYWDKYLPWEWRTYRTEPLHCRGVKHPAPIVPPVAQSVFYGSAPPPSKRAKGSAPAVNPVPSAKQTGGRYPNWKGKGKARKGWWRNRAKLAGR